MTINLLLVGFGHVGSRFVQLLDESRGALAALGVEPRVTGIVTGRHGARWDDAGLDTGEAIRIVTGGGTLGPPVRSPVESIARWRSSRAETRVLVETTPLDVRSGEPATSHIRAAFAAGADVITANKGPIACAYDTLMQEAGQAGRLFRFEGAVMDGIPIFSLVRETLPAATIRGFRGVVNSTTNYLIDAMERGEVFAAALARMQAAGVAEADPSLDVDGWDAAAKVAAMANVWLDAHTTPAAVRRETVSEAVGARARALRVAGRRLKVVGSAQRADSGAVTAAVELQDLEGDDPLAILDGQANALELDTWPLGRIVIMQRDGGLEKTAYALLSDLVDIARYRQREGA